MIQAILYIKILANIKSARKHSRMLPDSQTFLPQMIPNIRYFGEFIHNLSCGRARVFKQHPIIFVEHRTRLELTYNSLARHI